MDILSINDVFCLGMFYCQKSAPYIMLTVSCGTILATSTTSPSPRLVYINKRKWLTSHKLGSHFYVLKSLFTSETVNENRNQLEGITIPFQKLA